MNEVLDQERQKKPVEHETDTTPNVSVLRLQITYWLVLTGVLAVVGIIALIFLLMWLLPNGVPIVLTLELAIVAVGIIGTLVGTVVGYLLGSMGKDQAEKRADKNLALILEKLQKGHELNGKL